MSANQRLRCRFSRGEAAQDLTNRDILKIWEAALAEVTRLAPAGGVEASGDRDPARPKLAVAAPLPAGATSGAEVIDVYLEHPLPPGLFRLWLPAALSPKISLISVEEVGLGVPSPQSDVRWAEYLVRLSPEINLAATRSAVAAFLGRESLAWEEARETKVKRYDMRAVVKLLLVEPCDGDVYLRMRLQTDGSIIGRPAQLIAALDLGRPASVHRTGLGFATKSQVLEAWRQKGRFSEN